MPDSDRRRKMISIRLSEGEYEALKTHYRTYGARNVSELARVALQRIVTGPAASQYALAGELAKLVDRVHTLESRISLLVDREKAM
jgi:hypothetical protein